MAAAARSGQVEALRATLSPLLAAAGFDLESVEVSKVGNRSVVRVAVDRDGGLDLDAVADASRVVGAALDGELEDVLATAYVLEVTSPGVDRPLTELRHWRRAIGRRVAVPGSAGRPAVVGRVRTVDDVGVELEVTGRLERYLLADVLGATVQLEFNRTGEEEPT